MYDLDKHRRTVPSVLRGWMDGSPASGRDRVQGLFKPLAQGMQSGEKGVLDKIGAMQRLRLRLPSCLRLRLCFRLRLCLRQPLCLRLPLWLRLRLCQWFSRANGLADGAVASVGWIHWEG